MLGKKVKDSITGFTGTATARAEYLNSTPSIRVTTLHEGKIVEEWMDESRLSVTD
jgi:hypothetical protein